MQIEGQRLWSSCVSSVASRHSVGETIWGAVKFLDGDSYIAVTKSVNTYDYNDPKGGWGCIDYDGNVKIPLKYHLIIDGDTDMNAIVIKDQTVPGPHPMN